MNAEYVLAVIVGCTAVTWLEKCLPLVLFGGRRFSPFAERWLTCVPAAVLTALLVPEVLLRKGTGGGYELFLSSQNDFLIASVPALLVAYWKNSFFGAIVVGMGTLALLRYFF